MRRSWRGPERDPPGENGNVLVRTETPADHAAIRRIVGLAFGRTTRQSWSSSPMLLSWCACSPVTAAATAGASSIRRRSPSRRGPRPIRPDRRRGCRAGRRAVLLRGEDSNLDTFIQSERCCRYTTPEGFDTWPSDPGKSTLYRTLIRAPKFGEGRALSMDAATIPWNHPSI